MQAQQIQPEPVAVPDGNNTPLGREIEELLHDPAVSRAHWGISVTTMQGVPVFRHDDDKLFRPASTAKLFTTAAALALLGPEMRFCTSVYGVLDPETGFIRGDLTLVGGGDPSFGTNDLPYRHDAKKDEGDETFHQDSLEALAENIVHLGVKQITGNVVGDDSLFETGTPPDGWAAEDLLWGYGTLPSALSVGDNEVVLKISPGAAAASTIDSAPILSLVTANQVYPYLKLKNEVQVRPLPAGRQDAVGVEAVPGSPLELRVFGAISPEAHPLKEHVALLNPAAYTAGALRTLLGDRGIRIEGQATAQHAPNQDTTQSFLAGLHAPGCEASLWTGGQTCTPACADSESRAHLITEHLSQPLIDDVVFALKTSANLHAELMLHRLGLLTTCTGVTTLQGARVLRAWLLHNGIMDGDVMLYDGSGLSTKDLVTPRSQVQLLRFAATQPWFSQWRAALPVGGMDGTLESRFKTAPLKGRVFAKTGTLGETRALAGYVMCASGKQLIFSILVDNHEPGSTADRVTMDKIVEALEHFN